MLYLLHGATGTAYEAARRYQTLRGVQADRVELRIVDGDHDWAVWRPALGDALRYVLRFVARPTPDAPGYPGGTTPGTEPPAPSER